MWRRLYVGHVAMAIVSINSKLLTRSSLPTSIYAIAHSSEASQDQSPFSGNVLDAGLELQLNSELQQYS